MNRIRLTTIPELSVVIAEIENGLFTASLVYVCDNCKQAHPVITAIGSNEYGATATLIRIMQAGIKEIDAL